MFYYDNKIKVVSFTNISQKKLVFNSEKNFV